MARAPTCPSPTRPPNVYGFGVVGFDAVKVELVTAAGPRLPATLARQPFALSVRWWIVDYASEVVTSVVATDASDQTWTVPSGPAGIYGQIGMLTAAEGSAR